MTEHVLLRSGRLSLVLGGSLTAVFWLIALALGTFVGADVVLSPLWMPAQLAHVSGALLSLLGITTLFLAHRSRFGPSAPAVFFLAFLGLSMFLIDGGIALTVFPALATAAPDMLGLTGAMNGPPMLYAYIAFSALAMIGLAAFAILLLRAQIGPRSASILMLCGAVVSNLPPGPVPLRLIAVGGLVWGVGAAWHGLRLREPAA